MDKQRQQQAYENYVKQKNPGSQPPGQHGKSICHRRLHLCNRTMYPALLQGTRIRQGHQRRLDLHAPYSAKRPSHRI